MKYHTQLLAHFIGLVLSTEVFTAQAAVIAGEGAATANPESAVCTVVSRVTIDLSKPLTTTNPIEGIATLPAICNSRVFSKAEHVEGIRSLLVIGWRVTSASHQVTPLGTNASTGAVELLVSVVFSLERLSPTARTR
jgi:hypothetical protein